MSEYLAKFIDNLINYCTDMLNNPLWPNGPDGETYLNGLVRVDFKGRARGSYVEGLDTLAKTIKFLKSLNWEEFAPKVGVREGCRYYKAPLPQHMEARQNVIGMDWLIDQKLAHQVEVVDGPHGPELAWISAIESIRASTVTIIVEGGMMSTWYPGETFAELPKGFTKQHLLEEGAYNPYWCVKLIYAGDVKESTKEAGSEDVAGN